MGGAEFEICLGLGNGREGEARHGLGLLILALP